MWFGANLAEIPHLDKLFDIMNWNFIDKRLLSFTTKTTLKGLFSGKITNSKDFLKSYLKSVKFNCSPELLIQASNKGLSKKDFYYYACIAKDINHYLEELISGNIHKIPHLHDTIVQFNTLEKKIDFKWSIKRFAEEHKNATKEIMAIESANIPDEIIEYKNITLPVLPQEFELINTRKRLFEEGKLMSHCVYTNYYQSVKDNKFVVYHINYKGEEATLGLNYYDNKLTFNQLQGKYNASYSLQMKDFVSQYFELRNIF